MPSAFRDRYDTPPTQTRCVLVHPAAAEMLAKTRDAVNAAATTKTNAMNKLIVTLRGWEASGAEAKDRAGLVVNLKTAQLRLTISREFQVRADDLTE